MAKRTLLVLVILLSACTATTDPTTTTLDISWLVYEGPPSTENAALIGPLFIDVENHCVRVGDMQAIFPEGTRLDLADPQRPGLRLPSGRTVYSGETVEFGGGGGGIRSPVAGGTENCGTNQNFSVGY